MWARSLASVALAAGTLLSTVYAADLDPIVIKGSKFFFKSNGTQFFMKGVAYQASPTNSTGTFVDPLADENGCKRDIPLLQELGTNTIRVYAINTTSDHSACMKLLNDAGIYVVSDLSEPTLSINRNSPEWDDKLYARYTAVVDALAPYSNVLGFFAGNEVSNDVNNTNASPFVKAAIRDMKKYIKDKNYRTIPVGYATNDDQKIRSGLADYFDCGTSAESADFWGYNIYSWCGDSSYTLSGYDQRTKEFENYNIPAFFAEYGCNAVQPRKFTEVEALYGSDMTPVWSGGIVYMYYQEANDFGLVEISGDKATKLADFDNLKSEIAKVSPSGVQSNSYTPTNTAARSCPTSGASWSASTVLPPTPDETLCGCMVAALGCVAASTVQEKDTGALFSYICGEAKTDCSGITTNGTTGQYGSYSMCSPLERLSWAMNAYYTKQKKASDACDFNGSAKVQTPSSTGDCKSRVDGAGGTAGTSTAAASSSGSTTKGAAAGLVVPAFQFGALKIGAAMMMAVFGGAALVLV